MRTADFRPSDNVEDDREAIASRGVVSRGRWPWYRDCHCHRTDQLVSRHRSERPAQWSANSDRRRFDHAAGFVAGSRSRNPERSNRKVCVPGARQHRGSLDRIFSASGKTYHPPKLRLFAGSEPTPCAFARSAMGPFYCPRDQRIYLDTAFFNDLQNKFGGCTDSNACKFSEAYVIAHEVGHHVQNELGILPRVTQAQQASSSKAEFERASGTR